MPISKRESLRIEAEAKETFAQDATSERVRVGTLLVYSLRGFKGPFRIAAAHEVDGGFVTAVRHLDGSVQSLKGLDGLMAKRWVMADYRLTKPPGEVLALIGDLKADDLEPFREAVRPFVREKKKS